MKVEEERISTEKSEREGANIKERHVEVSRLIRLRELHQCG